jgi:glucuronoarabinoxylan endo-1,4-beta-xylanase
MRLQYGCSSGLVVLGLAALLAPGCFRDPDPTKTKCSTRGCPAGFVCVNPPHGDCVRVTDGGPAVDSLGSAWDGPSPTELDAGDMNRADVRGIDVVPCDGCGPVDAWSTDAPLDRGGLSSADAIEIPPPDAPGQGGIGGGADGRIGGAGGITGSGGVGWDVSGSGGVASDASGTHTDGADAPAVAGTTGGKQGQGGAGGLGTGGTTNSVDAPLGTGGITLTGGVSGVGGAGGATGTGGAGSGGTTVTGTGGSAPTGGVVGAGGATGGQSGGDTGSGGSGGGTGGTPPDAVVQLSQTRQTIQGFGISTAMSSDSVPWDNVLTTNGSAGIGLSIVRVGMTPNGALTGTIPPASYGAKIIGSSWSAPAGCKSNGNTQKGGHLKSGCYDSWATTIAEFAVSQGLYAVSAGSEPDFASCGDSIGPPCSGDFDTMLFTAKEMVAFVKVLGSKLDSTGVKLIAPEPAEWIHLWSNTSATGSTVASHPDSSDPLKCGCFGTSTNCASGCLLGNGYDYGHYLSRDDTAWGYLDILGVHEYDTQHAEPWPADVNGGTRDKEVWVTEMSGLMYWPEQGPSSDIDNGVAVAGWIHSALVVGEASAWLYWWYRAAGDDNEGLILENGTMTKRYFTLGNYSKFVRPGYVMVAVTGNSNPELLLSAFAGAESTVIVAINKSGQEASLSINIAGGPVPRTCTPNVTSASDNLKPGTAVSVSGGTFTAALAAKTVTTFVCK